MTLDEISQVGELVTESMDQDANVIWGARVADDMKGKLTVMTIITGVKSPWILGKPTEKEAASARQQLSEELGIEIGYPDFQFCCHSNLFTEFRVKVFFP